MRSTLPLWLAVLCPAVAVPSQEYRTERDEVVGIEFRVHNKLAPLPGGRNQFPRLLFLYQPQEIGDLINTRHRATPWALMVWEFPKDLSGIPEARIQARNFREFATTSNGDDNRKILVENQLKRARGRTLEHRWWEYRASQTLDVSRSGAVRGLDSRDEDLEQPFHYVAAVYDLPDKQIALVGVIPIKDYRTLKPDPRYMGILTSMTTSLKTFEPTAAPDGSLSPRDDTLRKAERLAKTSAGWDFLPGETHAVLYSWDPERAARKRDSQRFANKVKDQLERIQPLFAEELPEHPQQVGFFPIARVCYDYEEFIHLSASNETGSVAEFDPGTLELILYFDKARERVKNEAQLLSAASQAAWRQYAFAYFYVQTPVDLHRWYEIGLAAWFGAHQASGRRISYRIDRDRARTIRAAVDGGSNPGLEEFLTLSSGGFDSSRELHEAQAWALVDFLKRGAAEAKGFETAWGGILDTYRASALENRSPRRALADAIEGIDLDALEAAWIDWVKNELR